MSFSSANCECFSALTARLPRDRLSVKLTKLRLGERLRYWVWQTQGGGGGSGLAQRLRWLGVHGLQQGFMACNTARGRREAVFTGHTRMRAHMVEICFIPYECHVRHRAALESASHEPEPILQVLEALVVGDVIAEEHRLRVSRRCATLMTTGRKENARGG